MTSLFDTIRCLVMEKGLELERALCFVTKNVAKALEIYPRKGCLSTSSDADLLILGQDLEIQTVVARGRVLMEGGKILKKGFFED